MNPIKYISASEALSVLKSGDNVFIQTAAAAPQQLIYAMTERGKSLENISVYHLHTEGAVPYATEEMASHFNIHCFFIGANMRASVNKGIADYIPVFMSEVPALFRRGVIKINVALLHVSPPDDHGYCSLGVSVDAALAAMESAQHIIAQVNPNMPRTLGGSIVHSSRFTAMVAVNDPIFEADSGQPNETDLKIAENVASLIEDGATLQLGIGKIPNAVLGKLQNHKHLGVHTEMFSDGIINLVESGVITGEAKKINKGKIVSGFILGTKKLYDYVNDNPLIEMRDSAYVNDTHIIRQNPKVTAINSAVEVDITGQVCADSIGSYLYSGVGGQMDFIRGASLSEGGKPIIVMPSTTSKGESKIVSILKPGSGVVTTRAHVHYIVTEYGVADLYGKSIKERVKELIKITHPAHRNNLSKEVFNLLKIST
jgi:4-hydroxybutyrate CoA-transferase